MFKISKEWFFKELPSPIKFSLMFIQGDLIILLPLLILILLTGFWSLKFMTLLIGVYIAIRFLGEMIYWFSHQFNERVYRPYDFGFKNLDNHAIYILYQTFSVAGVVLGVGIIFYVLLYMR